ncbi:hypothetical protein OIU74_018259 [Salix koriyanagi]|uniref:Uncharacterized protein n=1 Tax=Salix koriyanagi TaxID=2511006 RepID=A0A9Q0WTS3_9ROSI|nr:hypothetical protein OIU74_018259 [Salix koriyanagi]
MRVAEHGRVEVWVPRQHRVAEIKHSLELDRGRWNFVCWGSSPGICEGTPAAKAALREDCLPPPKFSSQSNRTTLDILHSGYLHNVSLLPAIPLFAKLQLESTNNFQQFKAKQQQQAELPLKLSLMPSTSFSGLHQIGLLLIFWAAESNLLLSHLRVFL